MHTSAAWPPILDGSSGKLLFYGKEYHALLLFSLMSSEWKLSFREHSALNTKTLLGKWIWYQSRYTDLRRRKNLTGHENTCLIASQCNQPEMQSKYIQIDSLASSLFSLLPVNSTLSLLGSEVISKLASLALSVESRDTSPFADFPPEVAEPWRQNKSRSFLLFLDNLT